TERANLGDHRIIFFSSRIWILSVVHGGSVCPTARNREGWGGLLCQDLVTTDYIVRRCNFRNLLLTKLDTVCGRDHGILGNLSFLFVRLPAIFSSLFAGQAGQLPEPAACSAETGRRAAEGVVPLSGLRSQEVGRVCCLVGLPFRGSLGFA